MGFVADKAVGRLLDREFPAAQCRRQARSRQPRPLNCRSRNATSEQLRTVMAVEYDQGGMLKLKLRDPVRYLELLARNRGLLRDKVALTDASGGAANDLINRRLMWQLPIIRWQGSAKKIMD